MPAALTAIRIQPVAGRQHCLMALFRTTILRALATLIVSNCQLVHAADLPQVSSDVSEAANSPLNESLNQSPLLQTNSKVLPVDTAFALTTFVEADNGIVLKWDMPPGYYLYQKSLAVENTSGTPISFELPEAKNTTDEFFGDVAVYYNSLLLRLPFSALNAKPGTTMDLLLTYQGCAEALYCYPPAQKALTLKLPE